LNVFIDAISILYGWQGHRNFIRARALSFGLYVVFVVIAVVVIPLALAGPGVVDRLLPDRLEWLDNLYWPTLLLGSVLLLATLYRVSVPRGYRLRSGFPGGALALAIWIAGSVVLRYALIRSTNGPSVYGPLAAPIALLLWLYVVSLAVLIGAAFNAAIRATGREQAPSDPDPSEIRDASP
jgi:membrane protein